MSGCGLGLLVTVCCAQMKIGEFGRMWQIINEADNLRHRMLGIPTQMGQSWKLRSLWDKTKLK